MTTSSDIAKTISLDKRERATTLAALRYWARMGCSTDIDLPEYDIAISAGEFDALDAFETADLCSRLNTREPTYDGHGMFSHEAPKPTGKRIKVVCSRCGSDDIAADAAARWDGTMPNRERKLR